jgi:hypothetical protein
LRLISPFLSRWCSKVMTDSTFPARSRLVD